MEHPPDYSAPGSPDTVPEPQPPVRLDEHVNPSSLPEPARLVPGDYPSVTVIVLNYNGLKHLDNCFSSLRALDYPADRLELMLVDNGSSDGSLDFMREHFPEVRLVETGGNIGFAAGNDFGAERATGRFIALLNNDTRVDQRWLREMVDGLANDPRSGVVCTSSLMLDWSGELIDFQAGSLNFHGFGFQPSYGLPVRDQKLQNRDLLFACGGSMLVQRDVFLAVGGFDPGYFAFFEDVDLGWRLWLLGYKVTLTSTAITYHRHHGTAGSIPHHRTQLLFERNALFTIYKNYEQHNLDRILPAALLLLGQRAIRYMELGGVDLSEYEPSGSPPAKEPTENVHRMAVASLLAVDEFRASLEEYRAKREWLQANRRVSDEELFALFGQPGRVHLLNHASDAPYSAAHFSLLHEFEIEDRWASLPKHVLVISPDVMPVGEIPASGSGIRAWALGKGLESRGHRVRYTMPRAAIQGRESSVPPEFEATAWTPEDLQFRVDAWHPDVIVSCGWPNMTWLPRANVPVAIDLTGPHLLERAYQQYRDVHANSEEKLNALARGDFFTCIGERQRYYFEAWLAQAGIDVGSLYESLAVVPYSVDPVQPEHSWPDTWDGTEVRFVYGGIFLPWQNPAPALLAVASTLEQEGQGVLEVIGGKHPFHAVDTGSFGPLVSKLAEMPRVSMSGLLPHGELVHRYTRAHVAVDVMMPNAERELAFPSRTVHYFWCGLPVIHAGFSEVAQYIERWQAGWVVPHDDPRALESVVRGILADPAEARRRGENAQRLAAEKFSWNRTIDALDRFVREPYIRAARGKRTQLAAVPATAGPEQHILQALHAHREAYAPRELSERQRRVASRRRTFPAQVAARSAELIRSLAPLSGTRTRPALVEGQERFALPELTAGHSHGQRFLCPCNGLTGIRLTVGTFARRNTSRVLLHLRSNPGAGDDLRLMEVHAIRLKDGQTIEFRFAPVGGSANRWFYFVADSPDSVPGDAITFWATSSSGPVAGQRYEDGLPAPGSLVFSLKFEGQTP